MSGDDPRYPAGRFQREERLSPERRAELIDEIADLPRRLMASLEGVTDEAWSTRYRDGGWTVGQVVHHIADSHMNAFVRFRLALTEDTPTIKPYAEAGWAELPDVALTAPQVSIDLLQALHVRWATMMRALSDSDFAREIFHPEQQRAISLDEMVALYAWHGRHHLAHVEAGLQLARR